MSATWITHKGKKILYSTYGRQSFKEMMETLEQQVTLLKTSPEKVLLLDDFNDTHSSPEFLQQYKQWGKDIIRKKAKKNAMIGVTGLKQILFNAYVSFTGANIVLFATKAEALDYLVK